jgi:hypothetical protein
VVDAQLRRTVAAASLCAKSGNGVVVWQDLFTTPNSFDNVLFQPQLALLSYSPS